MTNRNVKFIFGLMVAVCACFITCDLHNPIMEKWWPEPEAIPRIITETFYTVTFDANEGIPVPGDQKIARGGKVGKVPAMSKAGYGFGGWYKDEGLTNEWNFAIDTVNADVILYAKWNPPPYFTVTFDAKGGRPEPEDQLIAAGVKIVEPTALRKAADTSANPTTWLGFGGWYTTDPDSDPDAIRWNFATGTVTAGITLYARWNDPAHVYVAFDADGGTPEPRPQDLMRGTKIAEPFAMNREGFGFGGWYTEPGFARQWNFAVDTVSDAETTSYLILYAKWVTTYFTVTFNAGGGSPAPRDQTVSYGAKLAKPPVMRNPGRGFGGWFTDAGFTTEWDFDDPVHSDMTLYAKWGEEYFTIVFDSIYDDPSIAPNPPPPAPPGQHGNAVPDNQIIAAGGRITEPPDVSRAGFCFAGWYTQKTGGSYWDFDTQITDEVLNTLGADVSGTTVTLYAYWVPEDPDMAWVKRGSFIMGDNSVSGAKPAHKVTITNGFYIDKYLVTIEKYNSVMSSTRVNHFIASGDTAPLDGAVWDDAIEYCNTLSADPTLIADNVVDIPLQSVYTGSSSATAADWTRNGYRLPTEAEWEYAARGGSGSPGNYIYAGSNNPEEVGWYNTNSGSMTRPVGTKLPNGLGIYDMSGNICEWCWDWFDASYYSSSPATDPPGPAAGTERSRRGGSWNNAYGNIRTTIRMSFLPEGPHQNYWTLGFRVVRGPVTGPSYTGL